MFGINIDPRFARWGYPKAGDPGMDRFTGVRLTSAVKAQPAIDYYKSIGKTVLAIVTGESGGYVPWNADIVQIGNEPDLAGTAMTPHAYAEMWNLYRNTYPGFVMFSAGLGSGLVNARVYLEQAWPLMQRKPDAIASHCYDGDVGQAALEIDDLWNAFEVPIAVTEWYRSAASQQIWDMQCMLDSPDGGRSSVWNSFFCYSDAMVPNFGLLDGQGAPRPEFYSLLSAPCLG